MTSRRRYPLPAAARAARGAGAVAGVAVFVSALIITGRAGGSDSSAATVAAADGLRASVTTTAPDNPEPSSVTLPDVRSSLGRLHFTAAELRAAAEPRASRSQSRAAHRWVRPNDGPLTSPFGERWGRLHAGIDLGGPYGSTIAAATDGCISFAGPEGGYGELMILKDWDGTETYYGHMSAFLKTSGCVSAGTPIAQVGAAGDATGPHLHFEVRVDGTPIDPIPFLAKRGVHIS